jgi:hypothetical protein
MSAQEDPIRTTVKQVHQWTTLDDQKPTKLSSRRSTCWVIAATWAATHVLLFWSLDLGPTVTSTDMISHISLGLPFPFLYQDDSWFYGNKLYHVRAHFVSPYENPTHMVWPNYFLDLALVWGSLLLITLLILWVIQKARGTQRTGS